LCFGAVEILGELTLGDVGNEADMGSGGLQVLVHIECREMAAIPKRDGSQDEAKEINDG
jgi:hypothetical protein